MADIVSEDGSYVLAAPSLRSQPIELWTARRLPFEPDQTADQKAMVRTVSEAVAAWELQAEDRVHGLFMSSETKSRQPDAENIAFYNWQRQGRRSPFAGPLVLRFERSFSAPPDPRLDTGARLPYYHAWTVAGDVWLCWKPEEVLAEWDPVPTPVGFGDDAGRHVWRAIVEEPTAARTRTRGIFKGLFAAEVTVDAPPGEGSAVEALKGCIDGGIAAFQQFSVDHRRAADVIRKHAGWKRWRVPITETRFTELAARGVGRALFAGNPFNLNGLDPSDDRCVAGLVTVRTRRDIQRPEVSGRLVAVRATGAHEIRNRRIRAPDFQS